MKFICDQDLINALFAMIWQFATVHVICDQEKRRSREAGRQGGKDAGKQGGREAGRQRGTEREKAENTKCEFVSIRKGCDRLFSMTYGRF